VITWLRASAFVPMMLGGCALYFGDPPPAPAVPVPDDPDPSSKLVFVTSETYQGNLGGLAGADELCNQHASSAGLGGTYRAWLSTGSSSPSTRMTHAAVPYTLVDGTMIASGWEDLVDGEILRSIDVQEDGLVYDKPPSCMAALAVWSATDVTGHSIGDETCGGWTSLEGNGWLGNVRQVGREWTDYGCGALCTQRAGLYCVEQ
jgi:hypothetical protein